MKNKMNAVVILFALILVACSGDGDPFSVRSWNVESAEDTEHEGLVFIRAENSFVVLGTNDKGARYTELPKMLSHFSYNFSIGKSEVTYRDFRRFTSEKWGGFANNVRKNLPVTDLTYYDAVLYANERSKSEGYDTAYTYLSAGFDAEGHCGKLDGLVFHPNVDAYRLPTEAEWMLVANQGFDTKRAWTLENAGNVLHDACTIGENYVGVCDMAGNALEWVNDWMSGLKDTVVHNFAGGADGGFNGERIVKGGYFGSPADDINIYSRGDVYMVTSATRAIYVGFRIAFGKIPDALWFSSKGVPSDSRLLPKISGSKMRSLSGSGNNRLVFRNDVTGNLAYVDYGLAPQTVFEIQDTLNCYHPDVSPDGKYVAFSTGMEGVTGNSSIYVRHIALDGDSLVKLNVENAAIPRWRIFGINDTSIVYVSDGGDNSNEGEFKKKSTWKVTFKKGKFGKPEKLFDGSYHGGMETDESIAVTGSKLLRARVLDSLGLSRESVWYDGEQACNVSLANDNSKRTLFLDFAGETGKKFVGKSYRVHERLLIADSTGKLIKSVASPSGYSFDHSEWVSGGFIPNPSQNQNLVIATLTNANGAHKKIVLVDLRDSSVVELMEGDEVWHPCLWVPKSSIIKDEGVLNMDGDSAAIYYESYSDPLLSSKMNLFWARNNYLKVIALGSSRMSLGFVPESLSVGMSLNMATIPSDMNVSHYIATNYILNHCPALKAIVVGLDFDLWYEKRGVNLKKTFLNIPGYYYDANHDFWKKEGYASMKRLSNMIINQSPHLRSMSKSFGWVEYKEHYSWNEGHFGYAALVADSTWSDDSLTYENAMEDLVDIIKRAKERNIVVLGVIFPQSPYYKKTGAFGRHGMRRSHAEALIERLKKMQDDYSNFYMLDENKMGNHDYPNKMAYDYDHLNRDGGYQVTSRIDSLLMKVLKK